MLTFNSATGEIVIDRGDGGALFPFRVTVRDAAGALLNVAAGSFRFTVKESIDDVIGAAVFQLTNPAANGIDLAAAASGVVDVIFPVLYTQALAGKYRYDLEMTLSGSTGTILKPANFIVRKDVSTPGSVTNPSVPGQSFPGYVLINGALYLRDQVVTTNFYKGVFENGALNWYGPSASIPF